MDNYGCGPRTVQFNDKSQISNPNFTTSPTGSYENFISKNCYEDKSFAKVYYKVEDTLSVTIATNTQNIAAWIDYNNDGSFDVTEKIMSKNIASVGTHTVTFTPPTTVVKDIPLRMRVIADLYSYSIASASHDPTQGQVEDYAITFLSEPLSIPLIAFNAINEDCNVRLDWQLSNNENIQSLFLERSMDGKNFSNITQIPVSILNNHYVDYDMQNGMYQYRLKSINIGGEIDYSLIRNVDVNCKLTTPLTIYPNPTYNSLYLKLTTKQPTKASIILVDINGKVILNQEYTFSNSNVVQEIDINSLPTGNYLIKVVTGDNVYHHTIIKK